MLKKIASFYFLSIIGCISAFSYQANANNLSYYGKEFYSAIERDNALKAELRNILTYKHSVTNGDYDNISTECLPSSECYTFTSITYSNARESVILNLFLEKDDRGSFVHDQYCGKKIYLKDRTMPSERILNIEHIWPQSKFNPNFPEKAQKSDLHNLLPVDANANSSRGNNSFSEIRSGSEIARDCTSSRMESIRDRTYFMPPQDVKGDIARAMFYFSVRWELKIENSEEAVLRNWHTSDPVDSSEELRNEEIFKIQKSRNPFIDHPSLVNLISDF